MEFRKYKKQNNKKIQYNNETLENQYAMVFLTPQTKLTLEEGVTVFEGVELSPALQVDQESVPKSSRPAPLPCRACYF